MIAGCLIGLAVVVCAEPPEYAISGYAGDAAQVVLAQTPTGPVTLLDLLIYDEFSGGKLQQYELRNLLDPASVQAEPALAAMRDTLMELAVDQTLGERTDFTPRDDVVRVMTFAAAVAAWTQVVVVPDVTVMPTDIDRYYLAHPEMYLQRQRVVIRYIFKEIGEDATIGEHDATRNELEELASRIRTGGLSFEEAAREHSDAASKSDGGLIPAFYQGTYFARFEEATYDLEEPGQMSPVFDGPGGYYLLQLVEMDSPRNIPIDQVRVEIEALLKRNHVRHFFRQRMAGLQRQARARNFAGFWPYLAIDAPIVRFADRRLDRVDFLRYYGGPTAANYSVDHQYVGNRADHWLTGEIVMRELAELGQTDHPLLLRTRELAAIRLKAIQAQRALTDNRLYLTTDKAIETIRARPAWEARLRTVDLVRITFGVDRQQPLSRAQLEDAGEQVIALGKQFSRGIVPGDFEPIDMTQWRRRLLEEDWDIGEAIETLDDALTSLDLRRLILDVAYLRHQELLPDKPLAAVIEDTKAGQFTPFIPGDLATGPVSMYFVVREQPITPTELAAQPLYAQQIVQGWLIQEVRERTRQRLISESAVDIRF